MGLWNVLADKILLESVKPFKNIVEKREPKSSTRQKFQQSNCFFIGWKECEVPEQISRTSASVVTFFVVYVLRKLAE